MLSRPTYDLDTLDPTFENKLGDRKLTSSLFAPVDARNFSKYSMANLSAMYDGRKDFPKIVYNPEQLRREAEILAKSGQDDDVPYASKFGLFMIGKQAYPISPDVEAEFEGMTEADAERLAIFDAIEKSGNKKLLKKFQRSLELSHGEKPEVVKDFGYWTPHAGFGYTEKPKTLKGKIAKTLVGLGLVATLGAAGIVSAYAHGPVDITPPKLKKVVKIDGQGDEWSDIPPIVKSDGVRTVEGKFQVDDQYLYYFIHFDQDGPIKKQTVNNFFVDALHHTHPDNDPGQGTGFPQKDDTLYIFQIDDPTKDIRDQSAWLGFGTGTKTLRKYGNEIHPEWNFYMPADDQINFEGRLPLYEKVSDVPAVNPNHLDIEGIHHWVGWLGFDSQGRPIDKGISLTESDINDARSWANLIYKPEIMTTTTAQTTSTPQITEKTVTATKTETTTATTTEAQPPIEKPMQPGITDVGLIGAALAGGLAIGVPVGVGLAIRRKKSQTSQTQPTKTTQS